MAKVGFRIDTIEPACSDKTIQQGSALTAVVAAEEDKILFPKTDGTKSSFGCVVIRLCQAIITVVAQRIPLIQGISERFAQTGFFRQSGAFLHQPVMQGYQQRLTSGPPGCQPLSCRRPRIASSIAYSSPIRFSGFLCCCCMSAYIDVVDFRRAWAQQAASANGPPSRSALNNRS